MRFYWLVIGILVVWRATHLFYGEDGPWDVIIQLRRAAGDGFLGRLMDCFYCLSLWVALPVAYWIGEGWKERLLLWPALSAGAILLQKLTTEQDPAPRIVEGEGDRYEENDDVLRKQANANEDRG